MAQKSIEHFEQENDLAIRAREAAFDAKLRAPRSLTSEQIAGLQAEVDRTVKEAKRAAAALTAAYEAESNTHEWKGKSGSMSKDDKNRAGREKLQADISDMEKTLAHQRGEMNEHKKIFLNSKSEVERYDKVTKKLAADIKAKKAKLKKLL